jgi:hypothetical protein
MSITPEDFSNATLDGETIDLSGLSSDNTMLMLSLSLPHSLPHSRLPHFGAVSARPQRHPLPRDWLIRGRQERYRVRLVEDHTRVVCLKASNPVTTAELGQQYSAEKAQMHPACGRRFPVGSVAVLRTTIDPRYDGPADLDGTRTRVVACKKVTAATARVEFNNCEVGILDGAHKGEHFHIPLECLVDEKGKHVAAESSISLNPLHRRAQMDRGDASERNPFGMLPTHLRSQARRSENTLV